MQTPASSPQPSSTASAMCCTPHATATAAAATTRNLHVHACRCTAQQHTKRCDCVTSQGWSIRTSYTCVRNCGCVNMYVYMCTCLTQWQHKRCFQLPSAALVQPHTPHCSQGQATLGYMFTHTTRLWTTHTLDAVSARGLTGCRSTQKRATQQTRYTHQHSKLYTLHTCLDTCPASRAPA